MSDRFTRRVLLALGLLTAGGVAGLCLVVWKSPEERAYDRITVGMSVAEVEAVLGPGTPIEPSAVPVYVVAVNPADEQASIERARKAGKPHTFRDYPVRHQPFVEGDVIYRWEYPANHSTWIGFKDGKVCAKWFRNLNCL